MTRLVRVTPSQVAAAQFQIELNRDMGLPTRPIVEAIANAKPLHEWETETTDE